MTTPNYIQILRLDKIAMKSKTLSEYLQAAKARLQFAQNLGVDEIFYYFVDEAWLVYGNGIDPGQRR